MYICIYGICFVLLQRIFKRRIFHKIRAEREENLRDVSRVRADGIAEGKKG